MEVQIQRPVPNVSVVCIRTQRYFLFFLDMFCIQLLAKLNKDNGEHKQRIVMYVTLNGIRIVDEKTQVSVPINQLEISSLLPRYTKLFAIQLAELFFNPARKHQLVNDLITFFILFSPHMYWYCK